MKISILPHHTSAIFSYFKMKSYVKWINHHAREISIPFNRLIAPLDNKGEDSSQELSYALKKEDGEIAAGQLVRESAGISTQAIPTM